MTVCAIVPGRGGSKGVPGKNLRPLGGHPLVGWAVAAGALASEIDRVIVSTDSPEIAGAAAAYGAEVPFLRPPELARDDSTDLDFLAHALDELERLDGRAPDVLVLLRPTTPLRDPARVDEAVRSLLARPGATALRSVHELPEPPQKMLGIEDGYLVGLFPHDPRPEYFNLPRQSFPAAYHPNGYADVLRAETIRSGVVYGARMLGFVTPHSIEVDRPEDLELLEFRLERDGHPLLGRLRAR